jgi:hypothetical protein
MRRFYAPARADPRHADDDAWGIIDPHLYKDHGP